MARPSVLPPSLAPRGLSRTQAAEYVGVSPNTFDAMVREGVMPRPRTFHSRKLYDRVELDQAFADLPVEGGGGPANSWDRVLS